MWPAVWVILQGENPMHNAALFDEAVGETVSETIDGTIGESEFESSTEKN